VKKLTASKKIGGGIALVMATVAIIFVLSIWQIIYTKTQGSVNFYAKWRKEFTNVTKPEQDKNFAVKINANEWFTLRLNCVCSSENEFDALIIRDSEGYIYTYDKHVCGYEEFLAMNLTNVSNLKELQRNLLQAGFKKDK
jgi:hypothetical protein